MICCLSISPILTDFYCEAVLELWTFYSTTFLAYLFRSIFRNCEIWIYWPIKRLKDVQILLGGEQIKYHANFVADSWLGDINESMMFTLADTHFSICLLTRFINLIANKYKFDLFFLEILIYSEFIGWSDHSSFHEVWTFRVRLCWLVRT